MMVDKESALKQKLDAIFNETLKVGSDFLAHHKGIPVLIGVGLVMLGLIVNLLPAWTFIAWLASTDVLLHLGVIVGLIGILVGDAL